MRALYHHRTQGREVEAVHICGLAGGLEQMGYEVEIIGPPGVDVNADVVASAPVKGKAGLLRTLAQRAPQALFECLEIGYNAAAAPRLWQAASERPAFIYERYALYNAAGALVSRLRGIPLVLEVNDTVHVDRTRQGKSLVMRPLAAWFERRIMRQATGIAVVSSYLKDLLVREGVPADRIIVTPNAVDPARFSPERVDRTATRARLGIADRTVVGFAGSFTKWHGVEMLIQAFASLAFRYPDATLLLVGDGARRSASEELVRKLGISDRAVFTGRVPHAEIPGYMAAMDIGVMPDSNTFGSPVKIFEYMAMGCAPVAPRYGPLEESFVDGESGLLFAPRDVQSMAGCLERLLAHPEERAAVGRAARRKVETQHQWVHNARAVLDLLARHQAASPQPLQPAPQVE
jgi:glycosyltransferase involved in cell wall biosynthesis